jgi:beta-fructofuranosidase
MHRFYRPAGARFGDTIPFFWEGVFHIFYLKRYADDTHDRTETDWWHVATTDFVHFEDLGVAVRRGGSRDADQSAATGSVVRIGDHFEAYYTGFSDWQRHHGGRHQTLLRSRSTDLVTWEKDEAFSLVADDSHFDPDEWRDPFVFWDAGAACYRMLIAAQLKEGPVHRRGVTAQATSPDGVSWTVDPEPFWASGLYNMHECPDYFQWGDYWYLVYSTLTDRTVTRYRMSTSPTGPWTSPDDDELDGLGLYAAKTLSDGQHRYLVGWATNSVAGNDHADWLWGGNLLAHELVQAADGTLLVRQPELARRTLDSGDHPRTPLGPVRLDAAGYESATLATLPWSGYADLRITPAPGTKAFGIELRADEDRRHGYSVRFEPANHRLIVDKLDRFGYIRPWDIRPFRFDGPDLDISLEFDGDLYVLYVGGTQAVTVRGYDEVGDQLAVFAIEGWVSVAGDLWSVQAERPEGR